MDKPLMPGVYVVAVSGGIDSVVLLHMLVRRRMEMPQDIEKPGLPTAGARFIVAHYDHGIRRNSRHDRIFVQKLAQHYGLPFVYDEGNLGKDSSEAEARSARYGFLFSVRQAAKAKAIITAHHQDDMLESAVINLLRGTNRKGLSSLKSTEEIIRPLLYMNKTSIKVYAETHGLKWVEDTTNFDTKYLRNYVRHKILSRFTYDQKQELLGHVLKAGKLNDEIDALLVKQMHIHPEPKHIDRHWFIMLPHTVARETMAGWLRLHGVKNLNSKLLEKLVVAAKTLPKGKQMSVDNRFKMFVEHEHLALKDEER